MAIDGDHWDSLRAHSLSNIDEMSDIGSVIGITIQAKSYFSIITILADKHKVWHSTLI